MSELVLNISAVAIAGCALLITGEPGSGKSSLALALIDRGATLIGDDGVQLEARDGQLIASPPPRHCGLIEVRNVGLVTLPATSAPCALVITLTPLAVRLPETPDIASYCGMALPMVALFPDTPALPLRAEYALKRYGQSQSPFPYAAHRPKGPDK